MATNPRCERCRFAAKPGKDMALECRRYAPRPGDEQLENWPRVSEFAWCGEFEGLGETGWRNTSNAV
jgi:hypothetical protein